MPIDREFLAGQHSGAINALFNAHRQLGRIEGARDVYLALHKLVEDEEQADAIAAANAAHSFAAGIHGATNIEEELAVAAAGLDDGLADAVKANLSALDPAEAPDRGKPIVVQELDHPHEGDPGDENDHAGSNDDPAAALAPAGKVEDLPGYNMDALVRAQAQTMGKADAYRDR